MKTYSWTTAGQAKDIQLSPNPLIKVLRRGRHGVWGPNRRRAIKKWSIAFNNDWVSLKDYLVLAEAIILFSRGEQFSNFGTEG